MVRFVVSTMSMILHVIVVAIGAMRALLLITTILGMGPSIPVPQSGLRKCLKVRVIIICYVQI